MMFYFKKISLKMSINKERSNLKMLNTNQFKTKLNMINLIESFLILIFLNSILLSVEAIKYTSSSSESESSTLKQMIKSELTTTTINSNNISKIPSHFKYHNQQQQNQHQLNLNLNGRTKRSVPEFEATLNAMKCALRIVGLQVSEHHNNMLMCCGLWKMKSFMKETADHVCENPEQSHKVFDDFLTDELIYGKFTHSILGDDTLDCKKYPEGSKTCERLFAFITFILFLIVFILIFLITGCIVSSTCWYRYRKRYDNLLKCKMTDLENQTEKDRFLNGKLTNSVESRPKRETPKWLKNWKVIIPGDKNYRHKDFKPITSMRTLNGRMYDNNGNKNGKSTPDSALPPSTNSTATSQNTSTLSLNEHQQNISDKQ